METQNAAFVDVAFKKIREYATEISGQWNGNYPGRGEDRAHAADELLAKLDEVTVLLKELLED